MKGIWFETFKTSYMGLIEDIPLRKNKRKKIFQRIGFKEYEPSTQWQVGSCGVVQAECWSPESKN